MTEPNKDAPGDIPPAMPQTPPPRIGQGHPEYHFVQGLMEIQRSLGELTANIKTLTTSVDSVKSKVDDIAKWKNMIVGGAITIGFLIATGIALYKLLPANNETAHLTTGQEQISPPVQKNTKNNKP